ncbi:MAG: hypothetical protein WCV79_01340 [Candidatus Paceibacterota bacterium]
MHSITVETIMSFIGGQLEIQMPAENVIYKAEVERIERNPEGLLFVFSWCAIGEGYPSKPTGWKWVDLDQFFVDGSTYTANNIGPSSDGGDDRLTLRCRIRNILIVLFPKNGNALSKKVIKGMPDWLLHDV